MFALIKAVLLGAFLTLIVCLFIGSAGSSGGLLHVKSFVVQDIKLYWSWALFLIGTGLAFGVLLLMD